jgi:hypothetical protein
MTQRDPTNHTLEDIAADLDASDAEIDAGLYVSGEAVRAKLRAALARPEAAQRAHWRFIGRGQGIHWPDLDEDISVEGLLRRA